jgi:hypothetical protein
MKGLLFQSINRKEDQKSTLREQIIVLIITPLQRDQSLISLMFFY